MREKLSALVLIVIFLCLNSVVFAGGSGVGELASDFTKLNLTLHEETIVSVQDLSNLEPGLYEFNVKNKTSEKVKFIIQDLKTEKVIGKIKIKPNKLKKTRVKLTKNGFKYQIIDNEWHEFTVN